MLICGDFNYPDINWSTLACNTSCSQLLLDAVNSCCLFQHVTEPTHYRLNTTANILDLVFTNEDGMINNIEYLPGIGASDHLCLQFNFICHSSPASTNRPKYNLNQADFSRMRELLQALDWNDLLDTLDICSAWELFSNAFTDIINDCIPKYVPRKRKNIFMTQKALSLRNKKFNLWRRYKQSNSSTVYQHYSRVRNELRQLTRSLRANYENKLVRDIKTHPRNFWKYVNSQLKVRPSLDTLHHPDNTVAHLDSEKSELLNNYFSSVFAQENLLSTPSFNLDKSIDPFADIEITPAVVYSKLTNLNPAKASGPEGWPILSLKECACELSIPLSILFVKSLDSSTLPTAWKEACVTPIFKKGDRHVVSNYRPISLTSPVVKILESIIKDQIQDHLNSNNLINPCQHGFTMGKSCTTQLLTAVNSWTEALEKGLSIDVIYFDFAKAFDSVPHVRLLTKLESYGLTGNLLGWLKSFLSGRKQKVVVNGQSSSWCDVRSGVPQGSVLGPLLFNVYINDITTQISSPILQFADDLKMFHIINDATDYHQLQQDINNLVAWANKWQLNFNVSKCHLLHFGKPHNYGSYSINGIQISPNDSIKDLGIIVDNQLKFHEHADSVVTKANRTLAIIRKSFNFTDKTMFLSLYKSLVRPIIEYGNAIWGPHYILDQQSIESVQRRFTKYLFNFNDLPYSERLSILGLPSLQYHRLRGDMILIYRMIYNDIGLELSDFFSTNTCSSTRGHANKFFKPRAVTRPRSNFFAVRSINVWNNLPENVIAAQSINSFKNLLDQHFSSQMFTIDHDW